MPWGKTQKDAFLVKVRQDNPDFEKWHNRISIIKGSSLRALVDLVNGTPTPSADAVRAEIKKLKAAKTEKYRNALAYLVTHFPGLDEETRGNMVLKGFELIANGPARKNRAILGMREMVELVNNCNMMLKSVVPNSMNAKSPGSFSKDERVATELFQKWFDKSRNYARVQTVKRIFTTLSNALRNQMFDVVIHGTPEDPGPAFQKQDGSYYTPEEMHGIFAFVMPAEDRYRIYLCSAFFSEESAPISIAGTCQAAPESPDEWQKNKRIKKGMDAAIITMLHEMMHIRAIAGLDDDEPNPYSERMCKEKAINHPDKALNNAENYALFAKHVLMEKKFKF